MLWADGLEAAQAAAQAVNGWAVAMAAVATISTIVSNYFAYRISSQKNLLDSKVERLEGRLAGQEEKTRIVESERNQLKGEVAWLTRVCNEQQKELDEQHKEIAELRRRLDDQSGKHRSLPS